MRIMSYAGGLGLVALIIYSMIVGRDLMVPFMIAIIIWYLIHTMASYFHKIRIKGWQFPKALSLTASILTMIFALSLLVDMVSDNIQQVRDAAPLYQENFNNLFGRIFPLFGLEEEPDFAQLFRQIDLAPFISNIASTLAGIAGNMGLILIYVLFLLLEDKYFPGKITAMLQRTDHENDVRVILQRIEADIEKYVAIKSLTSFMTGLACYVVLALVGVDYAGFWAFIIFLLNFIPTIGSMLAVVFPALLSLVQFDTFQPFFIVVSCLATIQFTIGNILEPRFMGSSLNLSPLVVMLSLAIWGSIWGVAGMFLSVPFTVILMIIFSQFEKTQNIAILLSQDGNIKKPAIES